MKISLDRRMYRGSVKVIIEEPSGTKKTPIVARREAVLAHDEALEVKDNATVKIIV